MNDPHDTPVQRRGRGESAGVSITRIHSDASKRPAILTLCLLGLAEREPITRGHVAGRQHRPLQRVHDLERPGKRAFSEQADVEEGDTSAIEKEPVLAQRSKGLTSLS